MSPVIRILAAVCALGAPLPAAAQQLGGQQWAPSSSADGVLGIEGAETRPALYPYVGIWLSYALDPVEVDLSAGGGGAVVEHLFAADVVASLALWQGLEVAVGMPVTLGRAGDPDVATMATLPADADLAPGDLRVQASWRMQLGKDTALALHVPVLLPTAPEDEVLARGLGVRPTLALSQWLAGLQLQLNASWLFRSEVNVPEIGYRGGSELGLGLGVRWPFVPLGRTSLLFATQLTTASADLFGDAYSPIELRLGIEHLVGKLFLLTLFAGTSPGLGIGTPDFRTGVGLAWVDERARHAHPSFSDRDGDRIDDGTDECPAEPEDPDRYQDGDGCPDIDDDEDGIPDWADECPNAPETTNDFNDDDGCPDYITVEEARIVTFEPVFFEPDSDVIEERSYPMLTEIARVLLVNPHLAVRVEGHSDNQGAPQFNLQLSIRRAASVKRFLISRGVPSARATSDGFGERRPITTNTTEAGRSRNRRVEFHLIPLPDAER